MKNKKIDIIFKRNNSTDYLKNKSVKKNKSIIIEFLKNIKKNIHTEKNIFHTFSEKYKFDLKERELKKFKRFKSIVIIGVGGSVLGAKAIHSFLEHKIKKDFMFLDNLDENNFLKIKKKIKINKTLFLIISKSGNTLETLVNMNLFNNNIFNSSNTIIVTEDKDNMLNNFSKERKIHLVNHRDYVGGRYSVLSETGMLPALFMNLNIKNFKKKILDFFEKDKKNIIVNNSLATSNLYLSKKINSIVFFNYSPKLKNLLYWCQQLIAESLGKKGKGLMPIISSAPRDHHSLLQLYLDGPKDKIFYIISSKSIHNYKINKDKNKKNFNYLKNKSLEKIVSAQKDAFIRVLTKNKIPFREIHINSFSESTIGELFAYFILETTIVGKLIGVNPYNQPAVEDVKVFTKKNLS